MNTIKLYNLLKRFLIEDIGDKDLTSEAIFAKDIIGTGQYIVKDDGIIAGLEIIEKCYSIIDSTIKVNLHINDGEFVKKGDIIATVSGPIRYLLSGERVVLNLLQRLSGIATKTNKAVSILASSHTKICDTRKTTPGIRMLEKYAVKCGGGVNHRFGLYDGVMIKDNHITYAGSISNAVNKVRQNIGHMVKIEVEIESKEELLEAIQCNVDVILLDNCSPTQVKEYVKLVPKSIVTEASGGISIEDLSNYRDTKVDYISLGMLTHSVQALDISFNLAGGKKYAQN